MSSKWPLVIGIFAVFFCYYDWLYTIIVIGAYGSCIIMGLCIGAAIALAVGKKPVSDNLESHVDDRKTSALKTLFDQQTEISRTPIVKQSHTIFTRNIDNAIDEVLGLVVRDFILPRLQHLTNDPKIITDGLKEDIWVSMQNLKERIGKIDEVKLLAQDTVNKFCQHYQRIRQASTSNGKEKKPSFILMPYLLSEDAEIEYLRKAAEVAIILLAPASYAHTVPVRHLLREIIVCTVLYPAISLLCDPDYINQKLCNYLQYHQEMIEQHKKTYAYSPSYEGFVKMIHECSSIDQLQHIRYNIMTEIMHSTTISNLKKSKGIDIEKEFISQGTAKGDLLQARNLGRYIKQLTVAKSVCEKRLKSLGGPDYSSPFYQVNTTASDEYKDILKIKTLPFSILLEKEFARCFFMKFLSREDAQYLLEFYVAVEELKECNKENLHQLASEIYKVYVPCVSGIFKFDRSTLRGMEAFLIANKGPEAFYEAQEEVYKFMEERYYPSFIVSDFYQRMMLEADRDGVHFDQSDIGTDEAEIDSSPLTAIQAEDTSTVTEYFTAAKLKLEQLEDKLSNKCQAVKAMRSTNIAEGKIIDMLENEIEVMKEEKRQLKLHIARTESWADNLGSWRVTVAGGKIVEEKDKNAIYFSLCVHLEKEHLVSNEEDSFEEDVGLPLTQWVVKRKISDFIELSQKLVQISSWIKTVELPKENKFRGKGIDNSCLDKATAMLQRFIDLVLEDEIINKSEALYGFMCPSPEYLKHLIQSPKKSKFFLSALFKSTPSNVQGDNSDDDELLFFDEFDSGSRGDRIAEPLYTLMGEIFDMRGVFMFLRRTLISFFQITFGRTINKQIRETVFWLCSESMIISYIHLFRVSIWPDGHLFSPQPPHSDEEKLETQSKAKVRLLNCIPDILSNLVGHQNAKKGTKKVFDSLQDARLNKQLFYELFEMLLLELFPEIKSEHHEKCVGH